MTTKNFNIKKSRLQCDKAGALRASFSEIAQTFVNAWQKNGSDMELLMEDVDTTNLNTSAAQTRINAKNDAIEFAESCIPTRKEYTKLKGGKFIEVEIPMYTIDDKSWTTYTRWVSAKAMDCPGAQEVFYKDNLDKIDPIKFKIGLNMLFDSMYNIPGGKSKINRAKVLFAHAMINSKRLVLGLPDSYQQIFGLWSDEKGRGKDVFIQSLGYALTGKIPVSHKITDISSNFNVDLARTHGMYYVAEMGKVTDELKNNLKNIITAPVIRMEKKGVDPVSCNRKFTVFMTCNEDLGPLFWDEAKERRCASVETYGSNYMYKTKRNIDNGNLYCLLVPFFEKLWEYCPLEMEALGLKAEQTQIYASQACRSNLEKCMKLYRHLQLVGDMDEDSPRQVDSKGWGPLVDSWFTEGKTFSENELSEVLNDTKFNNGQFHTFLKQFIAPNNGFCKKTNKNGWYILDQEGIKNAEKEVYVEYDADFVLGKPLVTVDIDAVTEALEKGEYYNFPEAHFKIQSMEDADAEFEANW